MKTLSNIKGLIESIPSPVSVGIGLMVFAVAFKNIFAAIFISGAFLFLWGFGTHLYKDF
jgi:hypothetical protein